MRESKSLKFAETSVSIENLREERLRNRLTFLKELNWDNYEKIRVVGKGMHRINEAVLSPNLFDGLEKNN